MQQYSSRDNRPFGESLRGRSNSENQVHSQSASKVANGSSEYGSVVSDIHITENTALTTNIVEQDFDDDDVETYRCMLEACVPVNGIFLIHKLFDERKKEVPNLLKRFPKYNQGKSLLVQAIECGNEEIVRYLVEDISSFYCLEEDGMYEGKTPIRLALESHQLPLLRVMIDVLEHLQHEDVALVLNSSNNKTIMHDVCARGSRALTMLLRKHNTRTSDPTIRNAIWTAATTLVDNQGYTPLLLSAKHGRFSILYALFDCCASEAELQSAFERTNHLGENMFHFACWHGPLLLHFDQYFLRRIQQWSMDHLLYQPARHNGWTPLHYACCSGKSGLVRHLLEHGACTNTKKVPGIIYKNEKIGIVATGDKTSKQSSPTNDTLPSPEAPFLLAAARRNLDIFKVFVEAAEKSRGSFGIDLDATNGQGQTLLHFAIALDRRDVAEQLISTTIDSPDGSSGGMTVSSKVNLCLAEHEHGHTPLHLLCREGWLDVIPLAASHMTDPSMFAREVCTRVDHHGQTPLMLAAIHGHASVVHFLVERCLVESTRRG